MKIQSKLYKSACWLFLIADTPQIPGFKMFMYIKITNIYVEDWILCSDFIL